MTATLDRSSKTGSVSSLTADPANDTNNNTANENGNVNGNEPDPVNETDRLGSDAAPAVANRLPTRLLSHCRNVGISGVVALFLVVAVGDAIPSSRLAETVDYRLESALNATGFYQRWALFSPEPLTIEVRTFAIVSFEDGSEAIWFPTEETNNFDSSTNERWRKWEGRLREDSYSSHWPATAQFVARHHATDDAAVASVRLVRTWSDVPPPDAAPNDRVQYEFHFYEWDAITETGWMLGEEDQIDAITS